MSRSENESPVPPKPMRLQRFLAQCGLGSRRDCEELITAGRVTISGEVADQLGATVDPSQQTVALDGERLKVERKKYFLLNKPTGFLCTANDPEGRRLVLDLFPEEGPRLFTVGRLDENTTGLLVVTNDGDLAQKLAHPRYRIFRTYQAQVAGQPRPEIYEQLKKGLFFTEGKFRVYSVKPLKRQKDSTWVEIVMTEGQNREIRRLFARVGHKIMKLQRTAYGPLRLGKLGIGEYRELTREELAALHEVLQKTVPTSGPGRTYQGPRRSENEGGEDRPRRTEGRPARTGDRPARGKRPSGEGRGTGGEAPRGRREGAGAERRSRSSEGERREDRPRRTEGRPARTGDRPARGKRPSGEGRGTGGEAPRDRREGAGAERRSRSSEGERREDRPRRTEGRPNRKSEQGREQNRERSPREGAPRSSGARAGNPRSRPKGKSAPKGRRPRS